MAVGAALAVIAVAATVTAIAYGNEAHPHRSTESRIAISPPPPPQRGPQLDAVGATSPTDVWAVGQLWGGPFLPHSLVTHFDGAAWTTVKVPNIHGLTGVAAIAPDDVWVIDGGHHAMHFDGSSWKVIALPAAQGMSLSAISASGPDDIWIVGHRYGARLPGNSVGNHTLALHWNGLRWRSLPSPNPDHRYDYAESVLAISPTNAWVVGQGGRYALSMHWDGARWRNVPLPRPVRTHTGNLEGVGLAGQSVWAVGALAGTWIRPHDVPGADQPRLAPIAHSLSRLHAGAIIGVGQLTDKCLGGGKPRRQSRLHLGASVQR